MITEVLNLLPGNQLRQSLGFVAASVICDNYTNSYLQLTDVGKTIPPWYYGAVVPLPPGVSRATAQLVATTPAIPGPPVPISEATMTWVDAPLPPDPGHPLQQVTTQQENVLGTLTAAAGASKTQDLAVPAGTLAIGFATYGGAGLSTAASVSVVGDQTGVDYFLAASASASDGVQSVPFDVTDTSITVTLDQTSSSSKAEIDVLAWPTVPAVIVKQNKGDLPIGVFLERDDGVALHLDQPSGTTLLLGVSMAVANPAPWQAPNLAPHRFGAGFPTTQATASELIAGVAGQAIRIFQCSGVWDSAGAASLHLVDAAHGNPGAGSIVADLSMVVTNPPPLGPLGPLTVGHSLYAWADNATVLRGVLSASQG